MDALEAIPVPAVQSVVELSGHLPGVTVRPYYDNSDSRGTTGIESAFTPAVRVLLLLNLAVYVLQVFLQRVSMFSWLFALSLDGLRHGFVWQLVTYGFLHAGGLHIFFNMLLLYFFGRDIERRFGTLGFLKLYLGAVVFGGVVFAVWSYLAAPNAVVLGASGGVVALLIAYALLWPHRRFLLFFMLPVPAWFVAGLCVVLDIGNALNNDLGAVVHVAGAAFGLVWIKVLPGLLLPRGRRRTRDTRSDGRDRRRMDRILDKVHEQGLHKLSWRERRFLKRMSRRMDDERAMDGHRLTRRQEWTDDSS